MDPTCPQYGPKNGPFIGPDGASFGLILGPSSGTVPWARMSPYWSQEMAAAHISRQAWAHHGLILGPFRAHFGTIIGHGTLGLIGPMGPIWTQCGPKHGPIMGHRAHQGPNIYLKWTQHVPNTGPNMDPQWAHIGSLLVPFWNHNRARYPGPM
jgi:hypothetical protein